MNAAQKSRHGEACSGTEVAPEAALTERVSRRINNAASRAAYQVPKVAPEVLLDMLLTPLDCKEEKEPVVGGELGD